MRKAIFPVSWLIQARLARVATVVDENINGVRIVKAFAGGAAPARTLAASADRVRWAYRRTPAIRSRWSPTAGQPAAARAWRWCCCSAAGW